MRWAFFPGLCLVVWLPPLALWLMSSSSALFSPGGLVRHFNHSTLITDFYLHLSRCAPAVDAFRHLPVVSNVCTPTNTPMFMRQKVLIVTGQNCAPRWCFCSVSIRVERNSIFRIYSYWDGLQILCFFLHFLLAEGSSSTFFTSSNHSCACRVTTAVAKLPKNNNLGNNKVAVD